MIMFLSSLVSYLTRAAKDQDRVKFKDMFDIHHARPVTITAGIRLRCFPQLLDSMTTAAMMQHQQLQQQHLLQQHLLQLQVATLTDICHLGTR